MTVIHKKSPHYIIHNTSTMKKDPKRHGVKHGITSPGSDSGSKRVKQRITSPESDSGATVLNAIKERQLVRKTSIRITDPEIEQSFRISSIPFVTLRGNYHQEFSKVTTKDQYEIIVKQIIAMRKNTEADVQFVRILERMHALLIQNPLHGSDSFNPGSLSKHRTCVTLLVQSHNKILQDGDTVTIDYGINKNQLYLHFFRENTLSHRHPLTEPFVSIEESLHTRATIYDAFIRIRDSKALQEYTNDTFCFLDFANLPSASEFMKYNIVSEYLYTLFVNGKQLKYFYTYDSFVGDKDVPYVVKYKYALNGKIPTDLHTLEMHFEWYKSEFNLRLLVHRLEEELQMFHDRVASKYAIKNLPPPFQQSIPEDPLKPILFRVLEGLPEHLQTIRKERLAIALETIMYVHHNPKTYQHVSASEIVRLNVFYTSTYAHFGVFDVYFDKNESIESKVTKVLTANRALKEKSLTNSFVFTNVPSTSNSPSNSASKSHYPPNTFVAAFVLGSGAQSSQSNVITSFQKNLMKHYNYLNDLNYRMDEEDEEDFDDFDEGDEGDEMNQTHIMKNEYLYFPIVNIDDHGTVINDDSFRNRTVHTIIDDNDNEHHLFENIWVLRDNLQNEFSVYFEIEQTYESIIDFLLQPSKTLTSKNPSPKPATLRMFSIDEEMLSEFRVRPNM